VHYDYNHKPETRSNREHEGAKPMSRPTSYCAGAILTLLIARAEAQSSEHTVAEPDSASADAVVAAPDSAPVDPFAAAPDSASAAPDSASAAPDSASADAVAAEQRGFDYLLGQGVTRDAEQAAEWFMQAAVAGRPVSQFMLGELYRDGNGVPADLGRALEFYRSAAEHGVARAQTALGWAYLTGNGLSRDPVRGREWLVAAVRQQQPLAMFLLGQIYGTGDGVERDTELSGRLLQRAAEFSYRPAMSGAAMWLLHRPGASADGFEKGMYLLEKAARQQDATAAYLLGQEYLRGLRVRRDLAVGADWIGRAAEANHHEGALWRAELYEKGLGVAQDPDRARELRAAALTQASAAEKNVFAWSLAVTEDGALRDAAVAVTVMQSVLESPANRKPAYLDTLAAAYAALGQFDEAVATQLAALEALEEDDRPAAIRRAMAARLEQYRTGIPYREAM
jgi:TPR repeat protein